MGLRCRHASPATPLRGRDVCAGMYASHTRPQFAGLCGLAAGA